LPVYIKTFFASTDKAFQESWFGRNVLLPLINALGKGLSDAATAASAAGKRIRELEAAGGWGRLFDTTVIKKFNKETKKTTDDMKKAAATTKLQGMFDIDAIQIAEALKGKVSDLDRARLEGMKALKTEATNDDIAAIKKIEYETLRANATLNSAQQLSAQNTFDFYKLIYGYAKDTSDEIAKLSFVPTLPGVKTPTGETPNQTPSGMPFIPSLAMPNTNAAPTFSQDLIDQMAPRGAQTNAQSITVNMQGGINIGTQYEFYESVQRAVQEANRNGWSTAGGAG
jgi:hypothetical protein